MSFTLIAGILSGVLYFAGTIPYIINTYKGSIKPQRASWFIWLLVAFILSINSVSQSVFYLYIVQLLCCLLVVLFSLPKNKGHGGWSKIDIICVVICAFSLMIKQIFASGDLSIILACIVEVIAFCLTYIKLYKHPGTEYLLQWVFSIITGSLALIAVFGSRPIYFLYPLTIFIGNAVISHRIYYLRTRKAL